MAGKIPKTFIDQLLMRVDIVEVIDRRVPLTRKGKEYQANCPFHEEKTPSFTVSPSKQFYYCFGCGAHGTAIGFLMQHSNLGFIEAVEELAAAAGLPIPSTTSHSASKSSGESVQLATMVEHANRWFQQQLRTHSEAKQAIAYLKERGLDGRIAAEFGLGYAPQGWDNLARSVGTSAGQQQQLCAAGLLVKRDKSGERDTMYDRFRGRIMFPIEDHRGHVVAFGGRSIGSDEPKYLNSPQTPLFHKGAELYGLHRARREIGTAKHSIVVEGYMDVVSLAQFGVDNAVATMGTATTRTHIQRLFRAAAEIVFCFDGDRAGRDAAWKAMQSALPEMRDGRQLGFLFLPEGEDPDSLVRTEGKDGFAERVKQASPLAEFLFDPLVAQVDMQRIDGRARLVSLAQPLLMQLPDGALRETMFEKLERLSLLSVSRLEKNTASSAIGTRRSSHHKGLGKGAQSGFTQGQVSPLASAISMLLQKPQLTSTIVAPESLQQLDGKGAEILLQMIAKITADATITTARLLESFRNDPEYAYLAKLATRTDFIEPEALVAQFNDTLAFLLKKHASQHRSALIEKSRQAKLHGTEQQKLQQEIKEALDARKNV